MCAVLRFCCTGGSQVPKVTDVAFVGNVVLVSGVAHVQGDSHHLRTWFRGYAGMTTGLLGLDAGIVVLGSDLQFVAVFELCIQG